MIQQSWDGYTWRQDLSEEVNMEFLYGWNCIMLKIEILKCSNEDIYIYIFYISIWGQKVISSLFRPRYDFN